VTGPQWLDDIKPEHHHWIWADRIARQEIHFMAGKPDVGKGVMLAKIVADISWGRDAFTGELGARSALEPDQAPLRPMKILYSAAEDGAGNMIRPRLAAQGIRPRSVLLKRFRLPLDFAEVADLMVQHQFDLVIFDPLASSLSGGVNRYSDNIRQVTDPLKELLEATNAAALFVDHTKKGVGPNSDPIAAVGGSSTGFPAACRMGFLFGKDPQDEDRALLSTIKHNIRIKPLSMDFEIDSAEVTFEWTDVETGEVSVFEKESVPKLLVRGEDLFNPIRLVGGEKSQGVRGRPANKRAQASEWLTTYLWLALQKNDGSYPVKGKTIQEDALQFGMSYRTLRRAAEDMKIVKSGKGGTNVTWSLPQTIIDMLTGEVEQASDGPEVAEPPVEEQALTNALDKGESLNADLDEWERNKPASEPDEISAEFDANFEGFLANLEAEGMGEDEPTE
jgi:hypothetical protein